MGANAILQAAGSRNRQAIRQLGPVQEWDLTGSGK